MKHAHEFTRPASEIILIEHIAGGFIVLICLALLIYLFIKLGGK